MNFKVKKIVAIQQLVLILFSSIFILLASFTTSIAVKFDESKYTEFTQLQPYNTKKYFKVFAETDYVKNKIVLQDKDNASQLVVDRGAYIYFDKKMNKISLNVQKADGTWKFYKEIKDTDILYIDENFPDRVMVNLYNSSLLSNQVKIQKFFIKVNKSNSVKYDQDENRYAVSYNGTIHVRCGEKLKLYTDYGKQSGGRNGYLYYFNEGFNSSDWKAYNVDGYDITVPVSSVSAAYVNWKNDYNSLTSQKPFRIRASNFITDTGNANSYTLNFEEYNPTITDPNDSYYITTVKNEKCGRETDYRIVMRSLFTEQ